MQKWVVCFVAVFMSAQCMAATYNQEAAETNAKLGLDYLQKGMYSTSKDRLLTAIQQDPQIAAGWYSMAYYLEKTGNIKAAEQYYRKALAVEPNSGSAMNNYGTFLCRTNRYPEAIHYFLKAAHERDYLNVASSYENAGTCALMMHNNGLALQYFHQAVDNNPSMPFSLLSIARLNAQAGNMPEAQKYFDSFKSLSLAGKPEAVIARYHDYVFLSHSKSLPAPG